METVKRCKQSNRPITYVLREQGSFLMEFIVVTDKTDILFEALRAEKLCEIETEVENFIRTFAIDVAKMRYMFDIDSEKWIINYVSTKDGKVLGSEKCYKRTVALAKRVQTELSIDGTQGAFED